VIAIEPLWLGIKNTAPPIEAQGAPMRVVIAGVDDDGLRRGSSALPVAIVGSYTEISFELRSRVLNRVEPLTTRVNGTGR
jgi:hypothetical protein